MAHPSRLLVEILPGGGGDEVVVPPGSEGHPAGHRAEGSEGDGEDLEGVRVVAPGHHPGRVAHQPAGVVLLLVDQVDCEGLHVARVVDDVAAPVERADDVHALVAEGRTVLGGLHVDDVVCVVYPEPGREEEKKVPEIVIAHVMYYVRT